MELHVGTLPRFIKAMNGELVIAARFADGAEVLIPAGRRSGRGGTDSDAGSSGGRAGWLRRRADRYI